MQTKLRLVDNDQVWQFVFRLQQERDQADGPERAVGKLVRAEYRIGILLVPVQNDLLVRSRGLQIKVGEERSDQADRADNSLIGSSLRMLAQPIEDRCQICP